MYFLAYFQAKLNKELKGMGERSSYAPIDNIVECVDFHVGRSRRGGVEGIRVVGLCCSVSSGLYLTAEMRPTQPAMAT